jgi:lipid-A-disaccharide synthase-like uncharacterized protein
MKGMATGIQLIGWAGQGAYFGRSILQWLASERARRSLVPAGFWSLSVVGALFMLVYAAFREDWVILLGQMVNLGIYLRNWRLEASQDPRRLSLNALRLLFSAMALALVGAMALSLGLDHSPWMLVGWLGQFIFLTRFPIQWWEAERSGRADLPLLFWQVSLVGSLLLLGYAIWRRDPVIAVSQGFGLLTYGRNWMLFRHQQSDPA